MHHKNSVNDQKSKFDRNNIKSQEKKKKKDEDEEELFMLDIREDPNWN